MSYPGSNVSLTQEHHNILYVLYYLVPFTWTRFREQVGILDETAGIRRAVTIDTVVDVQKCWHFTPLSPPSDDTVICPSEPLDAQMKFEIISSSSNEAKEQRALIESAKPKL
jgi:hypothetical protein